MFNLKRYFVLNKLYKYIVRIKFNYSKLKYLINFILQYCIRYKLLYDTKTLYCIIYSLLNDKKVLKMFGPRIWCTKNLLVIELHTKDTF